MALIPFAKPTPVDARNSSKVSQSQISAPIDIPGVWDWYLHWREQRRGFYTRGEEDMLMIAQALMRSEVGWIRQHPELLKHVRPIEGLIAPEEIEFASRDWHGACDAVHRHAANRSKEIQRVMRVHRDPFEPIMCVLEADVAFQLIMRFSCQ